MFEIVKQSYEFDRSDWKKEKKMNEQAEEFKNSKVAPEIQVNVWHKILG